MSSEREGKTGLCRVYTRDDLQQLSEVFYSSSTSLEWVNASSKQSISHVLQLCRMILFFTYLNTKKNIKNLYEYPPE